MTDEFKPCPRIVFYSNPAFSGTNNPVRGLYLQQSGRVNRNADPLTPVIIDVEAFPFEYDKDRLQTVVDEAHIVTSTNGTHIVFERLPTGAGKTVTMLTDAFKAVGERAQAVMYAFDDLSAYDSVVSSAAFDRIIELEVKELRVHNGKRHYVPAEVFTPWSFKNRKRFKRNQRRQRK